jgi:hypothetical protein
MRWIRQEFPSFAWIVLLSGQDYPAMSPRAIEVELLSCEIDAFIHWERVPRLPTHRSTDWQRGTSRRYYWHRVPGHFRPLPVPRIRAFVEDRSTFAGSQWWNLGRRAVDRILDATELTDYLLSSRFRSTWCPDEAFFQTALLNTPRGLKLINSHRRFYRFPRDGRSAHPETLADLDFHDILSSGAFFARKVHDVVSAKLLDRLDAHCQ